MSFFKKVSFVVLIMSSNWVIGQTIPIAQDYTIHEVEPQETLYSLSRKYDVSLDKIVAINPGIDEVALSIGQKVKIPGKPVVIQTKEKEHTVQEKETLYSIAKQYNVKVEDIKKWNNKQDNALTIGEKLIIKQQKSTKDKRKAEDHIIEGKKIHEVKRKETLYSISRQYGVSPEDLKQWNKLQDSNLSIGQRLIVGAAREEGVGVEEIAVKQTEEVIEDTVEEVKEEKEKLKSIEVFQDDKPRKVKNASGFEEIVQTGLAELIEGTEDTRKYLALHANAKVGTIMKVRNEMNNQMVFVRVIGTIPDTGDNDKLLIKLSKAAYDRLGALDKRFRVEVSYMP